MLVAAAARSVVDHRAALESPPERGFRYALGIFIYQYRVCSSLLTAYYFHVRVMLCGLNAGASLSLAGAAFGAPAIDLRSGTTFQIPKASESFRTWRESIPAIVGYHAYGSACGSVVAWSRRSKRYTPWRVAA